MKTPLVMNSEARMKQIWNTVPPKIRNEYGDEYFDDGGRLTAAYLASDYGAAYCGHSFTQRFGEVPECPGAVVTTSLCGP